MLINPVNITLNGDPLDVPGPVTVAALLESLAIDARRVAVEHNLVILKRAAFNEIIVRDGDNVEIVNFVGGG
jgi:thiamine biosynthesis protein ThiS